MLGLSEVGAAVDEHYPIVRTERQGILDGRVARTDDQYELVAMVVRALEGGLDGRVVFARHAEAAGVALNAECEYQVLRQQRGAAVQVQRESAATPGDLQ